MVKGVLIRLAWLLVLIYPGVFFAVVFFAVKGVGPQVIWIRGCCSLAASRFQFVGYGCDISDLGSGPIKLLAVT
jgi:hypothetical protein